MIDDYLEEFRSRGYNVFEENNVLWFLVIRPKNKDRVIRRLDKEIRGAGYRNSYGIRFVSA